MARVRQLNVDVGDRVAYSRNFLRSIACHTGPIPFARGTVKAVRWYGSHPIATVEWEAEHMADEAGVFAGNLVRVADMHLEHD